MYRIILFVIFSCFVCVLCVPVLVAQDQEQHDEAVEEEPAPPPQPAEPANVLARQLLDPVVAGRLRLDNRQRSEIDRIVQQQAEAIARLVIAGATEEQYQAVYKWYEDRLRDLLTTTQRAVLDTNPDNQNIRIRMVFMDRPWRDVLQIIADQAGMQLVLDAPPPAGTHNYSSLETYDLTQVLEHINGVLITRGYNLTRSEDRKKLHLLDLNAPAQPWSLPTEKPDKLGERTPSEYVSVTHNFSRRTPDVVAAAVRGQLGNPFSHYWLAGQDIIVFDRVEVQRRLPNVITNSQQDPRAPDPPRAPDRPPRDPPPPVWKTYTFDNEKIDPEYVLQVFREWAGGFRVLRDGNSRTIHISAQPNVHNQHDGLLKRLESDPALAPDTVPEIAPDTATPPATPQRATPQGNRTIRLVPLVPLRTNGR